MKKEEKSGFIYHIVSEQEKQDIQKQAKRLLSEFSEKLEKIKLKEHKAGFESAFNKQGIRKEKDGWRTDADFKDLMMNNAPFAEDNFIIAEKGEWKK